MSGLDDSNNPSDALIPAHKVQGTSVYNTALEKLGTLEDLMIDKARGRIAYAVLSFGGFLGIGERYYPLPWEKLSYSGEIGGYIVDIDRDVLEGAPSYTDVATASWNDVDAHYGVPPIGQAMP